MPRQAEALRRGRAPESRTGCRRGRVVAVRRRVACRAAGLATPPASDVGVRGASVASADPAAWSRRARSALPGLVCRSRTDRLCAIGDQVPSSAADLVDDPRPACRHEVELDTRQASTAAGRRRARSRARPSRTVAGSPEPRSCAPTGRRCTTRTGLSRARAPSRRSPPRPPRPSARPAPGRCRARARRPGGGRELARAQPGAERRARSPPGRRRATTSRAELGDDPARLGARGEREDRPPGGQVLEQLDVEQLASGSAGRSAAARRPRAGAPAPARASRLPASDDPRRRDVGREQLAPRRRSAARRSTSSSFAARLGILAREPRRAPRPAARGSRP